MKQTKKNLKLNTKSARILTPEQLKSAAGGEDTTYLCSVKS